MKKIQLFFEHGEFGEIEATVSYWKDSDGDVHVGDAVLHLSPKDVLEVQKRIKEETVSVRNPDHEYDSWTDWKLEEEVCGAM